MRNFIIVLIVGCGTLSEEAPKAKEPFRNLTPVITAQSKMIEAYVTDFMLDCVRFNVFNECSANMQVTDYVGFASEAYIVTGNPEKNKNRVGLCERSIEAISGIDHRRITIKEGDYDSVVLKALVYHELGHCLLGLSHRENGIMIPQMMTRKEYVNNWDKLVVQLFNKDNEE